MTTTQVPEVLSYQPDHAIPPGDSLRQTLNSMGMTQSDLAMRSGLSLKHVNQIIQGGAPITHETALTLEKVTGVSALLWNRLEGNYRERLARTEDKKLLASDADWLRTLPINELRRRKYIGPAKDAGTVIQEVCRFFGVANRRAWENLWNQSLASFRISKAFGSDRAALAVWLRIGEMEASEVQCGAFDSKQFRDALGTIRTLTTSPVNEWVSNVVSTCAKAGVAVVFVPEIKGARASGAARWLTPNKGLIQLSLRHKSDDHVWFSFFHEAGHLLLHSKKQTFVTDDQPSDLLEDEANDFAGTFLIPKKFESELADLNSDATIKSFAEKLGIAPGIVVGRLQKDGVLNWNQRNNLKMRLEFADTE
jgi:HTH-type transcriptional regulator/antitoxin HigA